MLDIENMSIGKEYLQTNPSSLSLLDFVFFPTFIKQRNGEVVLLKNGR